MKTLLSPDNLGIYLSIDDNGTKAILDIYSYGKATVGFSSENKTYKCTVLYAEPDKKYSIHRLSEFSPGSYRANWCVQKLSDHIDIKDFNINDYPEWLL